MSLAYRQHFGSEAVMTASPLRNITGQRKLDMITPMEALTGNIPNVQHLRIFGCKVWYFNRTQKSFNKWIKFSATIRYSQLDEQEANVYGTVINGSRIYRAIGVWKESEMDASDIM